VEVSAKLIEPEKERQVVKFLMKKKNLDGDGAFKKKSKRIRKSIWEDLVSPRKNPWICQS
jgi:hypothetical protein